MGEASKPRSAEQIAKSTAQTIIFGIGNHKPEAAIPVDMPWGVSFEQVWKPIRTLLLTTGRASEHDELPVAYSEEETHADA